MSSRSKTTPLVSVVIPMYNAESSIHDCIDSVLAQTYTNYEIIVVDDGSTDNSPSVVQKIIEANSSKNIQMIRKENGGVASARNVGLRAAKGEYIALLDSDDEWLPEKISFQLNIFTQHPEIDFLGCGRNNETIFYLFKKVVGVTRVSVCNLVFKMNPSVCTALIKKKALDDVGFYDETMRCAEDGDYWIRMAAQKNFCVTNDNLVITGKGKPYFGHSGLSANLLLMEKGEIRNIVKAFRRGYIGFVIFCAALLFSIFKFMQRIVIVKIRKIKG